MSTYLRLIKTSGDRIHNQLSTIRQNKIKILEEIKNSFIAKRSRYNL